MPLTSPIPNHEELHADAMDKLSLLAEQWLDAHAGGKDKTTIEEQILTTQRASRRLEEKINRARKRERNHAPTPEG